MAHELDERRILADIKAGYEGLIALREQFRRSDDRDHLAYIQSELDGILTMHRRADAPIGNRLWNLEAAHRARYVVTDGGTS
jgi:hypothetical protein